MTLLSSSLLNSLSIPVRRTITSPARRFNAEPVARPEFQLHFAGQGLLAAIAHEGIAPASARASSPQAVGREAAAVGKDCDRRGNQHLVFSNQALSPGESACPAAARAQAITA